LLSKTCRVSCERRRICTHETRIASTLFL